MGDAAHPYHVFDFTLSRGRDGPKYFLQDYNQVLLADAYGGYDGVVAGNAIVRAGCWAHQRRKFVDAASWRTREVLSTPRIQAGLVRFADKARKVPPDIRRVLLNACFTYI